jgi:hypothetical protein
VRESECARASLTKKRIELYVGGKSIPEARLAVKTSWCPYFCLIVRMWTNIDSLCFFPLPQNIYYVVGSQFHMYYVKSKNM